MSRPKRSAVLPAVLIGAGIAGLGLAAASELDLTWSGTFQAGAVEVEADCQEGPVDVTFSEPTFAAGAAVPWSTDEVEFSGISAQCHGLSYQAAYRTADQWVPLDGVSDVVGETVVASISGVDPQEITQLALTMQDAPAGS